MKSYKIAMLDRTTGQFIDFVRKNKTSPIKQFDSHEQAQSWANVMNSHHANSGDEARTFEVLEYRDAL